MDGTGRSAGRRRTRVDEVRACRVVVRFSESERRKLDDAARLAGSALAAWIGDAALRVADGRGEGTGVIDLLRLHADVVGFASRATGSDAADAHRLLIRLDAAIDAVALNRRDEQP
ncbi:hypothetical protein [Pseudonocardia abyssalis]|uniref:Mobilization protein n=1 Tax=Pseudonocardia abyssalis TaxID=2792008 RepID=A0ABS6USW4_9PSEU|nr:hypothetical protein [Pseudonocardia abyssalis]MBW0134953.1 hypothetical protein [Pseudonocardia abyssalis]